ncbi:hypothetical protein DYY67_1154 [Candidatus Nitrosotalea sp. TS]|nr:hypothetical protein [Candidatus Nitrosotalea sp. TS]
MNTERVLIDNKSVSRKELDILLEAMAKSSNRKKILVRFKFKYVRMEFREWLTRKQYNALRTINCLEFCTVM